MESEAVDGQGDGCAKEDCGDGALDAAEEVAEETVVVSFVASTPAGRLQSSRTGVHLQSRLLRRVPIVGIARLHGLDKPRWLSKRLSGVVDEQHEHEQHHIRLSLPQAVLLLFTASPITASLCQAASMARTFCQDLKFTAGPFRLASVSRITNNSRDNLGNIVVSVYQTSMVKTLFLY